MTTLIQPPKVLTATGKSASEVGMLTGAMTVALALAEAEVACPDAIDNIPANKSVLGVKAVDIRGFDAGYWDQL